MGTSPPSSTSSMGDLAGVVHGLRSTPRFGLDLVDAGVGWRVESVGSDGLACRNRRTMERRAARVGGGKASSSGQRRRGGR
jgi:hypothetical protein